MGIEFTRQRAAAGIAAAGLPGVAWAHGAGFEVLLIPIFVFTAIAGAVLGLLLARFDGAKVFLRSAIVLQLLAAAPLLAMDGGIFTILFYSLMVIWIPFALGFVPARALTRRIRSRGRGAAESPKE